MIPARLERATHSLEGCCSIQLSYGTFYRLQKYTFFKFLQPEFINGININREKKAFLLIYKMQKAFFSQCNCHKYNFKNLTERLNYSIP